MKNNKGTVFTEYAIIFGLTIVVLIPAWLTFGKYLVVNFQKYSDTFSSNPKNNPTIITPEINYDFTDKKSTLVDLSENESYCMNEQCNVNLGDYVINNIPNNIAELVETSGVSAATGTLLSTLEQIADQMNDQGLTKEAQDIKDLANLGYFIAEIDKLFEDAATNCQNENDPSSCMQNFYNDSIAIQPNDNIKHLLPNFLSGNAFTNDLLLTHALDFDSTIGSYQSQDVSTPFSNKYNEILTSNNISEPVKEYIKDVYSIIYSLNNELRNEFLYFYYSPTYQSTLLEDSLSKYSETEITINDLANKKTSIGTYFGSTVICGIGENIAENQECKKENQYDL